MDDDRTTIERGLDGARPASARGSDADRTLDARERGVRLFLSSTVSRRAVECDNVFTGKKRSPIDVIEGLVPSHRGDATP